MQINPRPVSEEGLTRGLVLDDYTVASRLVGPRKYDNEYSPLGAVVKKIKYGEKGKQKREDAFLGETEVGDIVSRELSPYLEVGLRELDLPQYIIVLPVPSYYEGDWEKRNRKHQYKYAAHVASLLEVKSYENLKKTTQESSKTAPLNTEYPEGAFKMSPKLRYPNNVLLVDDVYGDGRTLRACIRALKADENVRDIFFLGLVRTRTTGVKGA